MVVTATMALLATEASAHKAKCSVPQAHERSQRLMSFEIDDTTYPYIFNINGMDEGATPEKLADISLFDEKTGEPEKWYLGDVTMEVDRQRSKFRMVFGEMLAATRKIHPRSRYTIFVDWEHGTAGWLSEDMMFNLYDVLDEKPTIVAYPASCRRMD
ncbi:hypothetical protein [Rhizobium ruizarguesonis]|uniref:hypothetical protein n=2 Tax=Rhizobium TaxID=379 RepID=UPI00144734FF|nr:hypothetical protein [Rhizobium ruizarguesonis]